jgi:hypothetical protein
VEAMEKTEERWKEIEERLKLKQQKAKKTSKNGEAALKKKDSAKTQE